MPPDRILSYSAVKLLNEVDDLGAALRGRGGCQLWQWARRQPSTLPRAVLLMGQVYTGEAARPAT